MASRKLPTLVAIIALGAIGGMIGQNLVAQAGAPTLSDKTIYGKVNPTFSHSMDEADSTAHSLLSITIHAPSAGTASVDVNTQLWADWDANTTATQKSSTLTIGRCSAPNTLSTALPAGCANVSLYWFVKPGGTDSVDITEPYSINSLLTFTGAGTRTLYLNVNASGTRAGLYNNAHVQVAFTPKNPIANTSVLTVSAAALGVNP